MQLEGLRRGERAHRGDTYVYFFSSRRRHTRFDCDWSSDVCSSDLYLLGGYSGSIVSGNKTSPNFGGADYWILKLDADGNKLWEQSFGGTSDDYLYALQETQDGGIILGGYSSSPVSGNKTSPQYGASDFWVIKLEMPRPELTIAHLGQQLLLSWPSPSPGFVLEK